MNTKSIKQTLMCDLTDKERREYGISLATTLGDMGEIETQKKREMDHFKDRIAGLQAKADELSRKVRDGKEWRDVDCHVMYGSPDREHKQTLRLDTGETIRTERMTEADLQIVMPFNDDLSIKVGDAIDAAREEDESDMAEPEPETEEEEAAAQVFEEAPENVELLAEITAAKSVAKRFSLIEGYISNFGAEALAVVVDLAKRAGLDAKKIKEIEASIPKATTTTPEDY